ncbi:long-chain-fatty-acid--CoA ligase [Actinomadura sp. DC4]|uniref:long-chain-fatty-acid--CoA ligase n=1 Tax=Actinomadura sp. DC4 TaxID=3055069 RepID=UPI0025B030D8|nr:long-chain-fatty-acid--CoA ligase [Actinomadura sp. DC4]MDN3352972.1 long-chain-fatty-acid--CoA ligase [Actinomadura sp. DC4]
MNLTGLLRDRAAAHPDRIAYIYQDEQVTFAEFDRRVDSVAGALRASGVGQGDRVAVLDKNSLPYVELLFAAARIGAVQVPVNYRLAADEVAYIVGNAQAKILVAGAEFENILDAIAGRLEHTEHLIVIGDSEKYENYAAWSDREPTRQDDPAEVFVQLYSSGTTGLPKGVMLTHDNFLAVLPLADDLWNLGPESRLMVAMPMYHIAGCTLTVGAVYAGIPGVIMREPDPVGIAKAIEAHRVTHVFLVPVLLMFMQQIPEVRAADLSSLRLLLYGASPISDEVLLGAMRLLPNTEFMQVYGLTETTGAITYLPPADHKPGERLRSAGIANPTTELKIIDPATGEDLPAGRVGEIVSRTPQNMHGYWALEEATKNTLLPGGWLRTGDAGYLDEDGYLFIHDRVKDMIISGGENIYPAEVENVLMSHPAVADCAVIGVPDQKWGETPKAVVVREGETTEQELIDYCRERLAHFKCPSSVDFTEAIPRNPTGKVLKRQLREPYWEGESRAVH